MRQDFEDALSALIAQYADEDKETIMSALELALYSLKEDADAADD